MRDGDACAALVSGYMNMLKDCRPGRLAVEIGTYAGQTLEMLHDSGLFEKIVAIDPYIDGYDPTDTMAMSFKMKDVRNRMYKRLLTFTNVVHLNLTAVEASALFDDNSIDFLYIDGVHRYEAVCADIRCFLPKMRNLSVIAGHDYIPAAASGEPGTFAGVRRAVDQLLGGPDLLYEDSSWLKYLGYRPTRQDL
jgi:hypothetical protein